MAGASDALHFVTFNLRNAAADDGEDAWCLRRPLALEAIRRTGADVIAVQEALREQIEDLIAAFPDHVSIGVGRDDGQDAGEHALILVARRLRILESGTFWLSRRPDEPGSRSWGSATTRICTWVRLEWEGREFTAANLHLDHVSAEARLGGIEVVLARRSERPLLLLGDFNAGEDDAVFTATRSAGLRDSFRDAHPGATDVGTFNGFGTDFGPEKIDHILVSPEWITLGAEIRRERIGGRWPSDHAAVTAKLRLVGD